MYSGRKLFQVRLECVEIVSVDYFSVLDDAERSFAGRLNPATGVCRSDGRCDAVVLTGIPCGAGRENAERFAVIITCACILLVSPDNGALHNVTDFLINGRPVAQIAGQDKADYDENKFHAVRLSKITKKYLIQEFILTEMARTAPRASSTQTGEYNRQG